MKTKKKNRLVCQECGDEEAMYVTLKNGEKLPSFVYRIGEGKFCNYCAKGEERK